MSDMRNGVFIDASAAGQTSSGVEKKIKNQLKAFSKEYQIKCFKISKKKYNPILGIASRLPGGSWRADYVKVLEEIKEYNTSNKIDFFYIRLRVADKQFIRFLIELRRRYPNTKIIGELPTFPYSLELLQNKTMWPWFFKDKVHCRYLKKYLDRVATFSDDDKIYDVKTIRIQNGIDVDSIPILEVHNDDENTINLLAVAQFQKSHGYERVIRGLANYNKKLSSPNVVLHMVGEGDELQLYENLVNQLGLQDSVIFYGKKLGKDLEQFFFLADIGLGSFGAYKRRIFKSSSLKVREYLAYGIPVVSGVSEDAFVDDGKEYFLEYPNDNSEIDIQNIILFYSDLCSRFGKNELRKRIRDYARNNVDIEATMKPVIDYINS